jgi:hypothetical protein
VDIYFSHVKRQDDRPSLNAGGSMRTLRHAWLLVVAVATLLVARPAGAAEGDNNVLQDQIDKAPAGGVVTVPKGTWTAPLRVDKPLTLRGEDPAASIIDVTSDRPALRFGHPKGEATVENLTVRWKLATSNRPTELQAAVVTKDGAVRLRNVRVAAGGNFARCPSALSADGFGAVKIENCTFDGFEFALAFGGGATADILDSVVSHPGHCGITAGPESTVHVARTIVTGSRYHGLRCTGGELNAENNLVIANKNRGFYLGNKSARGTIRDNAIIGNGTGISAFAETDSRIANNFIADCEFAGIDMRDTCRLTVERNLLVKNGRGLALFKESGKDRNTIGPNTLAGNPTPTEGFAPPPPKLNTLQVEFAEGEFTTPQARDSGPSDPSALKPVWERWTAVRKQASTRPAGE